MSQSKPLSLGHANPPIPTQLMAPFQAAWDRHAPAPDPSVRHPVFFTPRLMRPPPQHPHLGPHPPTNGVLSPVAHGYVYHTAQTQQKDATGTPALNMHGHRACNDLAVMLVDGATLALQDSHSDAGLMTPGKETSLCMKRRWPSSKWDAPLGCELPLIPAWDREGGRELDGASVIKFADMVTAQGLGVVLQIIDDGLVYNLRRGTRASSPQNSLSTTCAVFVKVRKLTVEPYSAWKERTRTLWRKLK